LKKFSIATIDHRFERLGAAKTVFLAAAGAVLVGYFDYATGYELSVALFYLGPIALASWYAGSPAGIAIAVISSGAWYISDLAAGHHYSHPAIPIWNAFVRLGIFLVTSLLLVALRTSYRAQQHLARTDALTGLHSRRAFDDALAHDLALARRRGSAITLACFDLDDFKRVNDRGGHAMGDRVLRDVGRALKELVREGDTAARIGGDEFAIVMPETDGAGARKVASKLARALEGIGGPDDRAVTCSVGMVTVLESGALPADVLAAADRLLYEIKRTGKGRVAFGEFDNRRTDGQSQRR
jgi:diguanylate cyclase (GGDEF)-like protein